MYEYDIEYSTYYPKVFPRKYGFSYGTSTEPHWIRNFNRKRLYRTIIYVLLMTVIPLGKADQVTYYATLAYTALGPLFAAIDSHNTTYGTHMINGIPYRGNYMWSQVFPVYQLLLFILWSVIPFFYNINTIIMIFFTAETVFILKGVYYYIVSYMFQSKFLQRNSLRLYYSTHTNEYKCIQQIADFLWKLRHMVILNHTTLSGELRFDIDANSNITFHSPISYTIISGDDVVSNVDDGSQLVRLASAVRNNTPLTYLLHECHNSGVTYDVIITKWKPSLNIGTTCPITYEDYTDESIVAILKCGHGTQSDALRTWMNTSRYQGMTPTCPICRNSLPLDHNIRILYRSDNQNYEMDANGIRVTD